MRFTSEHVPAESEHVGQLAPPSTEAWYDVIGLPPLEAGSE
jgi:hypothetical protein